MSGFLYPELWSFKPFFTIQPVAGTRDKQLNGWRSLILQYCSHHNVTRFEPNKFPLFRNDIIDRSVSPQGIAIIVNMLINNENAEWEDQSHTWLRIILKSAGSLAGDIYAWAVRNDFLGSILTVYELHSGEDHQDSGFYGTAPADIRRALTILENEGKCVILGGATSSEEGVKFLPL